MYYISRLSAEIGARIFENTSKSTFIYPHFQFFLVQKGSVSIFFSKSKTEYILHENDVILVVRYAMDCLLDIDNLEK